MIVAEINVVEGGFGDRGFLHTVPFSDLVKAETEFDRIAELVKKHEERANDLPRMLEVDGDSGIKVSLPMKHVRSVSLVDFEKSNDQRKGLKDTYPLLFK